MADAADCCGLCFCCCAIASICGRGCLYWPCCRDRRLAAEDEEYAAQVEEAQLYNNTGGDVPNQMPVMTKGGEYAPNQGQPPERANVIRDLRQDAPDMQPKKQSYADRHGN